MEARVHGLGQGHAHLVGEINKELVSVIQGKVEARIDRLNELSDEAEEVTQRQKEQVHDTADSLADTVGVSEMFHEMALADSEESDSGCDVAAASAASERADTVLRDMEEAKATADGVFSSILTEQAQDLATCKNLQRFLQDNRAVVEQCNGSWLEVQDAVKDFNGVVATALENLQEGDRTAGPRRQP